MISYMGIRITPEHKYYNDKGTEYISVTQILGKYKQPFDARKVAEKYAGKHGNTPEYWMERWDTGRDEACDKGHVFHDHKEEILHGRGVDIVKRAVKMVRNQYLYPASDESLYNLPDGVYAELQMWDDVWKLAGTADKVHIETMEPGKRFVDIDDHKTNKRIDTQSYQFSDGSFKMMQYPAAAMMDCNFTHYELQISFYAYMLERQGFIPRRLTFTHYPPPLEVTLLGEQEKDVTKRTDGITYHLKYRKKEVINILTHYARHENSNRRASSSGRR